VDAAFINATLVNGRTQDDFLYKSHPGAVSVPSALAICEEEGATGADLIAAVVAGYELTARAYLGGPTMLPAFRATGVAGAIGACAAAARAMRLDVEQTVNALGLAAIFASGFGAGFLTGTMDVKLNVGMAARNGVSAAILARAGATASDRAFEGEAGYYAAVARTTEHAGTAVAGLGERYLIQDTVYKDYPICIFTQTPVAIARAMVEAHGLNAAQIQRVTVTVCDLTFTNPGFRNVAPFANQLKARVSARFCIAAAMLGRPIDAFEFYDQVDDRELLAFAERIDLVVDPARSDSVTIAITTPGGIITNEGSEGETLHPTEAKVIAKFQRLVSPVLGAETERLLADILSLEHHSDIRRLTERLRPGHPTLRVARS
jgi:2-methylcitrate dehydratase PrpD